MKKILIVGLLALLLTGCSKTATAKLSNGNEVIFEGPGISVTANDLYNNMKIQDYTSVILDKVLNYVATKEEIDMNEINANVEEDYQLYVDYGYESYIISYYGSKENFIKNAIQNAIAEELMYLTAEQEFDKYADQYKPYQAQIAYFSSEEEAQTLINGVNNQTNTFEYLATELGYSLDCAVQLYTDSSDLPIEVKETALKAEKIGFTNIVASSTTATDSEGNSTITPRYYVIYIVSKNTADFKDDFNDFIVTNYLDAIDVIDSYITKYNVRFYDQKTYDLVSESYPGVK